MPVEEIAVPWARSHNHRTPVIDGFKRLRALQRLGRDTIRAVVWDLDETDALLLDRAQRNSESLTALEQGWLLVELRSRQGLSVDDFARRLDKSPNWVSRRLALVCEIPEAVQEQIRRGVLAAQTVMRCLVPLARISKKDCLAFAEAIACHALSPPDKGDRHLEPSQNQQLTVGAGVLAAVEPASAGQAEAETGGHGAKIGLGGGLSGRSCAGWRQLTR